MYAVIETGGKQYKVQEGDVIYIEKLSVDENSEVTFDKVLAVANGDALTVGSPLVEGAVVTGKVLKNGKGAKVIIFKYKAKKGYRRKKGHRQHYTKVEISKISA